MASKRRGQRLPFAPSHGAMCGCNEKLAKSSGNCKALHQTQRSLLRWIVRNPPGKVQSASALVASRGRPARLHLRPSLRDPLLSTRAHAGPPTRPRDPSPTPRRRYAAFRSCWLPSLRPLPGSGRQSDPPRPGFLDSRAAAP